MNPRGVRLVSSRRVASRLVASRRVFLFVSVFISVFILVSVFIFVFVSVFVFVCIASPLEDGHGKLGRDAEGLRQGSKGVVARRGDILAVPNVSRRQPSFVGHPELLGVYTTAYRVLSIPFIHAPHILSRLNSSASSLTTCLHDKKTRF